MRAWVPGLNDLRFLTIPTGRAIISRFGLCVLTHSRIVMAGKTQKPEQKAKPRAQEYLSSVDVWEFARQRKREEGTTPLRRFERLAQSVLLPDDPANPVNASVVRWTVSGHSDRDGRCQLQIEGEFSAAVPCLRCSGPVALSIAFDRLLRLCKSEQEADTLETDENEDAVAAPGKADVLQWLEDEMMLCLPMFPAHDACQSDEVDGADAPGDLDDGLSATLQGGFAEQSPETLAGTGKKTGTEAAPSADAASKADTESGETHRPFAALSRLLKKPDNN